MKYFQAACKIIIVPFVVFGIIGCNGLNSDPKVVRPVTPNILWLVAEDLSPYIPPFGDSTVQTPNLTRLANEGVTYNNVFSVSGVCSPSRAALATGMYPSHIGAHHMRTLFQQQAAKEMGLINYECVPPPYVKMVSEILRENGYYCSNNAKEDYQFFPSKLAWDESSIYAHWRNRPDKIPFFSVFNFGVTHESNLWNPFGRTYDLDTFPPERTVHQWWKNFEGQRKPLYVDENLDVRIPPYLPNTATVKKDIRRMYSNIVEMDRHVGLIIQQLEEDDLLDNTIIIWFSDHGGPLPRQKRLLYDSGLHVPMIIRYPDKWKAGETDEQLISFVDLAATLLTMANLKIPDYMQGQSFYDQYTPTIKRQYIFASADRFDEKYDMIRAVRDKRFKYLKNFKPNTPYYLPLEYRENMASMQELLNLKESNQLNDIQMQWFRNAKPEEELFDTYNDPHELHNLANDSNYTHKLSELRQVCMQWMEEIDDKGFIPENDLINQFWPDRMQPTTDKPVITIDSEGLSISCNTKGASIGYKYPEDEKEGIGWRSYNIKSKPLIRNSIKVIAHRIGYLPSDTVTFKHNSD